MISVDQALAQIDSLLPTPLEAESVPLENVLHRVLREAAISLEDQPPIDRSSIDGYLVHPDQNKGSVRLLSAHPPGQPAPPLPPLGSAVRILTGSSLPAYAALIMQEDTLLTEPGLIELLKAPTSNLVRPRGSHSKKGDILLSVPRVIQPGSISLLASLGITQPKVSRVPRVAHLATGTELVDPDKKPALGQIRDSNSILIRSLLVSYSADLVWQKRVGDTRELFTQSLQESLNLHPDILLLSGASSVGDHDYAFSVLEELGLSLIHISEPTRPY